MVKRAVLFINGGQSQISRLKLGQNDLLIGVDGGTEILLKIGKKPDLIIGDLDSLKQVPEGSPVIRYPRDKDFTDSELAIRFCLESQLSEIVMVGILGHRLDHLLANIFLAAKVKLTIYEGNQTLQFLTGPERLNLEGKLGDLVSLIPLLDCESVTTTGLKWPLQGSTLAVGTSRGVSNVMMEKIARVTLEKGRLMVVYNRL